MAEVKVNLPAGGYNIIIEPDSLDNLGFLVSQLDLTGRALVVTDENVGALYGERTMQSLAKAGITAALATVPPGEDSKSLQVALSLYTMAIETGLDRQGVVIALGGGVVGDLAGFVAATYLRGVPFVQVPTTLLAQVDSSVGGKVAVNHTLGKNLIGAFYQPRMVVADTGVLKSLPARQLATGIAEVIKYGLIADEDFFGYLVTHHSSITVMEEPCLREIIRRSCEIKARVVEEDEKETHLRMILNFGHTIGHAVEADTAYEVYTHGEAVAIGMHGAALISFYLGLCSSVTLKAVRDIIRLYGLPLTAPECQTQDLLEFLQRDKKSVGGAINWVLLNAVGQVTITKQVPQQIIRKALNEIVCKPEVN